MSSARIAVALRLEHTEAACWRAVLEIAARRNVGACGVSLVARGDAVDVCDGETADALAHCLPDGTLSLSPAVPPRWAALLRLYLPLCIGAGPLVVAHLGQSLDGRIATVAGASHYVTGPEDILHNHRMRALSDAIIVGAATVAHDDPQLTVRRCEGRNPVRVVIDSERRLCDNRNVFRDGAAETIVLCAADRRGEGGRHGNATVIGLPRGEEDADGVDPGAVVKYLLARGMRRLFIEGGGITVSRFLAAGCVDRLQVTIAPLILGSGRPSISLPEIATLRDGLRPETRRFDFGDDVMFECLFRRSDPRPPLKSDA